MEQLLYLPASMVWPLAACLVLTGIHVYLGVHVIARKVIFVDLALAQIAALGTVIGVLLGYEVGTDDSALYLYSLAFTIFGAFIFSVTKMKGEKVPHEAIIGIVYAVTFAATILVISKSALGPQELDHILKGELLWVRGGTVLKTAGIYFVVGLFHFLFRRQFITISFDSALAERQGMNVRLWDFLFYMSFGFVITSSVAIAGVFLVFSYLVIPAVGAMLLSDKLSTRLAIGWVGGAVCSFVGVKLSWDTGLPTSPLVVCVLAGALLLAGLVRFLRQSHSLKHSMKYVLQSAVVVGVFIGGLFLFQKEREDPLEHLLQMFKSPLPAERLTALQQLTEHTDHRERWASKVVEALSDPDAQVRRAAIRVLIEIKDTSFFRYVPSLLRDESDAVKTAAVNALRTFGGGLKAEQLVDAARREEDPELKLMMIRAALDLGNPAALPILADMVAEGGFFSAEAYEVLTTHVGNRFPKTQMSAFKMWLKENGRDLYWDEQLHKFVLRGSQ
ncbi:MAG: hypothetical protein HBSIN02_12780 [Bacteroidia bacterium]|nr:MAG: hypothetical protein HBSIN02_12780 [Bacteroidia bacterium]